MSRNDDKEEIEEFWAAMALEAGEEILKHGLLRVMQSEPVDLKDKWLLFFSSPTGLYFKRFPTDSLMGRMMMSTRRKEKEYPLEYMPWERLTCLMKGRETFFSRLMGNSRTLQIDWGGEKSFFLELDCKSREIFADHLGDE